MDSRLQNFLELYYSDSNIPLYLYDKSKPVLCVPSQDESTYPPKCYFNELLAKSDDDIAYIFTEYGACFGRVHINAGADLSLITGPVFCAPVSEREMRLLSHDYVIKSADYAAFKAFIQAIPVTSTNTFLTKLIFLCYCFNGKRFSLFDLAGGESDVSKANNAPDAVYDFKQEGIHNRSFDIENEALNLIRRGDVAGVKNITVNLDSINAGVLASSSLRQMKNNIIVTTTLATRAAIDGGADTDLAYKASDSFIQAAENTDNAASLWQLMAQICPYFAGMVADGSLPRTSDEIISHAIRYIRMHINEPITATEVAAQSGYSRSRFDEYFKNQLGFTVAAFIKRCRLEEAKQLLRYTDKSLAEIADYLCFSSQSHFQSSFKTQFGMTPLEYRKKAAP